jgi:hypothetical protein
LRIRHSVPARLCVKEVAAAIQHPGSRVVAPVQWRFPLQGVARLRPAGLRPEATVLSTRSLVTLAYRCLNCTSCRATHRRLRRRSARNVITFEENR